MNDTRPTKKQPKRYRAVHTHVPNRGQCWILQKRRRILRTTWHPIDWFCSEEAVFKALNALENPRILYAGDNKC